MQWCTASSCDGHNNFGITCSTAASSYIGRKSCPSKSFSGILLVRESRESQLGHNNVSDFARVRECDLLLSQRRISGQGAVAWGPNIQRAVAEWLICVSSAWEGAGSKILPLLRLYARNITPVSIIANSSLNHCFAHSRARKQKPRQLYGVSITKDVRSAWRFTSPSRCEEAPRYRRVEEVEPGHLG